MIHLKSCNFLLFVSKNTSSLFCTTTTLKFNHVFVVLLCFMSLLLHCHVIITKFKNLGDYFEVSHLTIVFAIIEPQARRYSRWDQATNHPQRLRLLKTDVWRKTQLVHCTGLKISVMKNKQSFRFPWQSWFDFQRAFKN